jgi:DNA polymerase III delta prime subunit
MSLKNLLLWEKYRPKTLEDIILLPRIRQHFENGITKNYIFSGHYGTGKTSLARILIGKYTKDKAFLEINSSLYTSIETLRSDVEKFCKTQPMLETDDPIKYIFLDEFERVSSQYQDALKAFIEQYHKNVRFILTTNHLNKISDGIKSRFTIIDFDCKDHTEEKFLKQEIYKRITNQISKEEEFSISKDDLVTLINKKFPDFRGMFVELQNLKDTGNLSLETSNISNKLKLDLYNFLYDESADFEKIYHFLMSNFGQDKIDILFKLLGKNFIDWSISEKRENIDKLFDLTYIISENTSKLETNTDPIILGMTVLGKFRKILIGK